MSINKPFRRTVRAFLDGNYSMASSWRYVQHPTYSQGPESYIGAFLLIQKDLQTVFDYIEPSNENSKCYSFRIHEIIMRSCIEIEANFKSILAANRYHKSKNAKARNMDIKDYFKINQNHRLCSYKVKLPFWRGDRNIRSPFKEWISGHSLSWYNSYNNTKHNRDKNFQEANLDNAIDAVCALYIVLSSQFFLVGDSSSVPASADESEDGFLRPDQGHSVLP